MLDYLAANMWQVWAVVAVLGLILELFSGDFVIICFAIGAAAAALASLFTGIYVQLIIFALITLVSLFMVRPVALRYLHKGEDNRVSNADALVYRCGKVSQDIPAGGYGRVAIDGDDWKAKASDGSPIAKGQAVQVIALESTIITVQPIYPQ